MKNLLKILGIIVFIAIIGGAFYGCDFLFGSSDEDEDGIVGGSTSKKPEITIQNNTGYTISGIWIKSSTATSWGSGMLPGSLLNGSSRNLTVTPSLFDDKVDIRVSSSSSLTLSSASVFSRYSLSISREQTITLTSGDLTNENYMPAITIQNRSGVSFNSVFIKPSVSSDWGTSFGSISNNSNSSETIPIPPSSYTTFDIQARSTNPANTYTKNNVTISNGMIVTFTSEDSDNALVANPVIVIQNSTGYTINGVWIKPAIATSWGSGILSGSLSNGSSRTFTLSQSLSIENIYDIRVSSSSSLTLSSANVFSNYCVVIYEGMIITLTSGDLTNENYMPAITIQNRSGVSFNSVFIKPSVSSDWGTSFGSISNNSNSSETIPIPPSSYTTFDIQARSTNPANTYTKNNVTISNGNILTFTSADSDNALLANPVIVLQNNTGYSISGVWIKPSTSTSWGSSISGSIADGASRAYTLSQSLSANNVYDIRLRQTTSSGNAFTKSNVTVSEGMIVVFMTGDSE